MEQEVLADEQSAYNNDMVKPVLQVFALNPKLPIVKLEYNGLKLNFIKPYMMTVKVEGEYLVHENAKLNMVVYGKTLDELIESFFDDMCFLWRDYALANDSELAPCAIKLKQYLLSQVREAV